MLAAEILLPEPNASFLETFIYTSNRNDPHSEGDTIAIFSLAAREAQLELEPAIRVPYDMITIEPDANIHHTRGPEFSAIRCAEILRKKLDREVFY
ncbi:uncharacterized protein F5891DRAFT_672507 [Suillus fuscotomentosus]|uniref:Uncharacterized protein n=1 Tax=Suillus fuscotomentosus TaxID=1912939 RepID=A0AAD4DWE8_9AGAM|nr:uncharacterized protein F5891DRAFT_672507 [Suillus fuscotomentosus]KAG1895403.1 hypothetical protein F5891DRAFT_672507 [Suillus fuscotomentosus]